MATVMLGLFAVLATLIALIALPHAVIAKLILFLIAAVPLFLAMRSRGRATKARGQAQEAGERAWQAAAEDVAKKGTTAKQLAKALQIDPKRAERLLTASAAHDRVRIDVNESAEVIYRSDDEPESESELLKERAR